MRVARPRLTIRRLMILVALVAVLLGIGAASRGAVPPPHGAGERGIHGSAGGG